LSIYIFNPEFSDLHSDESQSLAPRTNQPSLQGPSNRPLQGLPTQYLPM
jgi:hypothetical protein